MLGDSLKEKRLQAGFTQHDVARTLGVSFQTVSNWESGKHEPKGDHLDSLAELYGVELQGLIEVGRAPNVGSPSRFTNFAIRGYVSAGNPKEAWEVDLGTISLPQTGDLSRHSQKVFALVVSGDSLEGDGIEDGDTLLVDADAGIQVGSIHIVRIGYELCARHVFLEDDHVRLKASNDHYEEITASAFDLVGKVVGHIKYRSM
ncbi:MAG: helix-turn-helix domain-containing protein [Chloroflexi bacterium]|nr:helix-turn-helix domain-containing protein [Chloroflexota bacterium]